MFVIYYFTIAAVFYNLFRFCTVFCIYGLIVLILLQCYGLQLLSTVCVKSGLYTACSKTAVPLLFLQYL